MNLLTKIHGKVVHERRVDVLATALAPHLRQGWRVADVGSGDGRLASLLAQHSDDVCIEGFEVMLREDPPHAGADIASPIKIHEFDGRSLPLEDRSVDAVVMVDVLHHTDDPMVLLREAKRVARHAVILKDHLMERPLANVTLRFMDWVGNRGHGVALPYNYWSEGQWRTAWQELDLTVEHFQTRIGLYSWPANWLFEKGLHFVARLNPNRNA
jgi:SAM-dependent methyltransferase